MLKDIKLPAPELSGDIGTCAVGAFDDEKVGQVLKLPDNEMPLYILTIGYL
ncbi:MAG TPA: hypothetical protein C5S51_03680 [Methanosarcinaceae archaeon]|nr:hypothetical protein [Methanosarcinaceae archaeon]